MGSISDRFPNIHLWIGKDVSQWNELVSKNPTQWVRWHPVLTIDDAISYLVENKNSASPKEIDEIYINDSVYTYTGLEKLLNFLADNDLQDKLLVSSSKWYISDLIKKWERHREILKHKFGASNIFEIKNLNMMGRCWTVYRLTSGEDFYVPSDFDGKNFLNCYFLKNPIPKYRAEPIYIDVISKTGRKCRDLIGFKNIEYMCGIG